MIAAIYARKSTEQNVSEDAKSVTRQVELARAFAERQGWRVDDARVYVDDALSGADFTNRTGLASLLTAASQQPPPFAVIVTMDESRIGRDQYRTAYVLQQIADAGVRLWYYQEQREAKLDDATGKFMESVRGFAAEMEREKARARTREALRAKAARGLVAGGVVYGYRNVEVQPGERRRVVDEAQAATVRRIFEMAADGKGLLKIAKALNADDVPSPAGRGWATTGVREMLRRDLYRGRVVYGRTRWVDRGGRKVKVDAPESEWVTVEQPELHIVSDELWEAAHQRIARTRQTYTGLRGAKGGPRPGQLNGRPESGLVSRHLLSGFLRCGVCGGNMFVAPRSGKRGKVQLYYVCTTHHKRGNTRCTNRHGAPYAGITKAILSHFREHFLNPVRLGDLLQAEWEERRRNPEEREARRQAAETDVRRLDGELGRLTEAVASGGSIPALVTRLQATQRRRDEAAATLAQLESLEQAEPFDVVTWLAQTRQLLTGLQTTLEADPVAGRHVLRGLLTGPITLTPCLDDRGRVVEWDYLGEGIADTLVAGRLTRDGVPVAPVAVPTLDWPCDLIVRPRVRKADTMELVPPAWVA